MKLAVVVLLPFTLCGERTEAALELDRVAHIASVMIDGDVCRRIPTDRSEQYMVKIDPRDPWVAGDNYDVDPQAFTATKKTLMRLAKLCREQCDVNLWMPVSGKPTQVQIVIRNVFEMSQFWTWGALTQDMPPEMKTVFDSGERATVQRRTGMTSVLAPVYDCGGDVVGLVEVVAQNHRDQHENVK
jgi:hypothetical protein